MTGLPHLKEDDLRREREAELAEQDRARQFFYQGGAGFEGGEDGARAARFSFDGMLEYAIAYAEFRLSETREAAQYLVSEVSALKAFGPEVAEVIGWTNWKCLQDRKEALAALAGKETP